MHPEMMMIGMLLEKRNLHELLGSGLRPEHLGLPVTQAALKYAIEFESTHGSLPTVSEFLRQCPGLVPEAPPKDLTAEALAAELIGLSLERQTALQLESLRMKPMRDLQSVQEIVDQLRTLAGNHQMNAQTTASDSVGKVTEWYKEGKEKIMTGMPYPWDVLNMETRGLQKKNFIVLYGRPKTGKTFQLLHMLSHLSLNVPGTILFVSFEMDSQALINRLVCIRAKVNYRKFNRGELNDQELQDLEMSIMDIQKMKNTNRNIVFVGPAISTGRRKKQYTLLDIEQMARETKAVAIFVDGLLHAGDLRTGKRSREWTVVSNLSSDTKQLALNLDVPIIATHQANREGEKETPIESQRDMAYADALGQDADITLRLTKIRSGREGGRKILIQPTGAREFELLGFTVSGAVCEGMNGVTELVPDYKKLKELLRKETVDDPMEGTRSPTSSLGAASIAGHNKTNAGA